MPRPLQPLVVPTGQAVLDAVLPPLAAALDGTGPALLLLPDDPSASDVVAALRPDEPVEDGAAVVVATSGSTGAPKGVVLGAQALTHSARAATARLGGDARWLLAMPARYAGGLQVLVRSLLAGTTPVALDLRDGFRPEAFVAGTERLDAARRCTSLVPTQLRRLLDAGPAAVDALRAYDAVLLGGAAAPGPLLTEARTAGVRVVTTYGMTETSGGCVYDGVPLDGVHTAVDDDGRVRLRGPVLMSGYRLRPDLTAEVLVDGWFLTSDLGSVVDGRLVVWGRADDVVVTGGEKVGAAAVEDALTAHPGVRDCAVVGVPDREWGQRVHAYVVPVDGAAPPPLEVLREHVARSLPRSAAPRSVAYLDALPRLPSGKVDRLALSRSTEVPGRWSDAPAAVDRSGTTR